MIFTCCLCAGNSLFIESTQKGRFYGSKSSRPGYVPRETFFIESPQMGRFYESEPARPWLYRQKLLIRDICPFSEVPRVYCLDFWKDLRESSIFSKKRKISQKLNKFQNVFLIRTIRKSSKFFEQNVRTFLRTSSNFVRRKFELLIVEVRRNSSNFGAAGVCVTPNIEPSSVGAT
jgi:hypothetical protein